MISFLILIEDQADRAKFVRLYDAYNKMVFYTAFRIIGSHAIAEEAAQEVWIGAARNIGRISGLPGKEAKAYLITAAKNAAFNALEKEKKYTAWEEDDFGSVGNRPGLYESEGGSASLEYEYLVNIVMNLPVKYSRTLELKFVLEWKNKEIAEYLGISQSTVASRISGGRRLIIEKLKEEGYYEG